MREHCEAFLWRHTDSFIEVKYAVWKAQGSEWDKVLGFEEIHPRDKEEHRNDYNGVVRETLDFDKAIEEAIRFAEKDGHTLVIISADHETGGTVLNFGVPSEGMVMGTFTSRGHSPMMVPLFAYGPKSGMFMGTQENSDVSNKIYTILSGKK